MADNNSYEVNVTLNDFNGIITKNPNGDGTYNVTYTSLTKDQINEIGQQFAKHLSDTDENGNSKAGLHKVALTGNYTQLENKPSASNLQGFHEVAFSGQASALDNGTGNNVTFLTKTAFDKSVAGKIKQSDVNSWNAKSDFSGNYEDLNNLPNLSAIAFNADYRNLQNAPEIPDSAYLETTIINGEEVGITPLGFHIVAFSGDYNNIENKINYVIQLNTYNNSLVQTLASEDCIINDSNTILLNNKSIEEVLILAAEDFIQRSALIYIQNNYFKTLITTVRKTNDFYEIGLAPIITSNYNTLKEQENIDLDTLNSVVGTSVLIIDINKHRILCKYNNF